ncbi:MRP-like protein [Aspergillus udagawae]|uniref:MRP-like protein n=1 Tax=Aspergillus udagawae TaxID=91492 RepID=A0ABQ1AZ88_9EURO|nr:MRP-like protein [Aspergillus udagawae]
MIADLNQPPRVQHADGVRVLDGTQPMRHGIRGPLPGSLNASCTIASDRASSAAVSSSRSRLVTGVVAFAEPHQFLRDTLCASRHCNRLNTFAVSAGDMVLKETNAHNNNNLHSLLEDLNVELSNRLAMQQPASKTLALVEGGRRSPDY